MPKAIGQIRGNMKTPLPESYVDLGINTFGGLSSFFASDVPAIFSKVDDDALQARFKAANAAAIKATREMAEWYAAQKPQATQNFALGAEKFSRMLHASERVDIPIDQLKADRRGRPLAQSRSLRSACHDYAPGKTLEHAYSWSAPTSPKVAPWRARASN